MSVGGINPNDLGNMGEIEQQFAVKTVEHLEVRRGFISPHTSKLSSSFFLASLDLPASDPQHPSLKFEAYQVSPTVAIHVYRSTHDSRIPLSSFACRMDDAIMEDFQQTFPELDSVEALTKLNENEMKSPQGKERWRNFIMKVSTASASFRYHPAAHH